MREFKLGDRVISHRHGVGDVIWISNSNRGFGVKFKDGTIKNFYRNGTFSYKDKYLSLFHFDEKSKHWDLILDDPDDKDMLFLKRV